MLTLVWCAKDAGYSYELIFTLKCLKQPVPALMNVLHIQENLSRINATLHAKHCMSKGILSGFSILLGCCWMVQ